MVHNLQPKKKYFKTPLVSARVGHIKFPRICPVCCDPTTTHTVVALTPNRRRFLCEHWDPVYIVPRERATFLASDEIVRFVVPVCEYHLAVDEMENRSKTMCIIFDGICGASAMFAYFALGGAIWMKQSIPIWVIMMLGLFAVMMLLTWTVFRPNEFQRAFQIVGFDPGLQHVLLKITNKKYREALLQQNPMDAKLVNWVVMT